MKQRKRAMPCLQVKGVLNTSGSLNIELLMGALARQSGKNYDYSVHRVNVKIIRERSTPV
ncbi:MAG: hypothetical protein V8Q85_06095 [Christensenellales bacterium]